MNSISNLTNRKNKLIADATDIVQRGLTTPERKEQYRKLLAEADTVQEDIDLLSTIERKLPGLPAPVSAPAPVVAPAAGTDYRSERRAKSNAAWRSHFKNSLDNRIPEHRDILTTTASDGASLIPQEFQQDFLATTLKYYAPLTQFSRNRFRKDGRPVKTGHVDDTANGMVLLTEGSSVPEADPTFSSTLTYTDLLTTGQVQYSNELLDDSDWDLSTFLSDLASIRYGRGLERILTRGVDFAGTATPNNPGLINIAPVGTTTTALTNGIGWTDLVNLFNAVDTAYLPKAVWQMTASTRNTLLGEKDGFGRPYFTPAPNMGDFDMLLNKPIVINESLDQIGTANGLPVLFGSLYDGLEVIGSELRVTNLYERYIDTFESALIVSTRVGSAALAPGAIQALKLAAS